MAINKTIPKNKELEIILQKLQSDYGIGALREVISENNNLQVTSGVQENHPKLLRENLTFEKAIQRFIQSEEFEVIFKKSTQVTYISQGNIFLNYCDKNLASGRQTVISEIELNLFLTECVTSIKVLNTRNKLCTFLRSFIKSVLPELVELKNFDFKEVLNISPDNNEEPKTFNDEQVYELFCIARQGNNNLRNYCLLWVLLSSGIRLGEIINLQIKDIKPETQDLLIIPMKKKYADKEKRKINIQGLEVLMQYITFTFGHQESYPKHKDFYVFSKDGGKNPLCPRTIQAIIKDLVNKATTINSEFKKNFSTHSFRHTFAMNALTSGVDFYTISMLLGHTNIASTVKYLNLSNKQLVNAINKHPFSEWDSKSTEGGV